MILIEALSSYTGRNRVFEIGEQYEVESAEIEAIQKELKKAKKPEFEYKLAVDPGEQKVDQVAVKLAEYRRELIKCQQAGLRYRKGMAAAELIISACEKTAAQTAKVKKKDIASSEFLGLLIKRNQARLELAKCDLAIAEFQTKENEQVMDKIQKLIDQARPAAEVVEKEQQTPDDKQLHPDKNDRTK